MALYNWFTEGFDPTGTVSCITRAQLLQMVHAAKPSAGAFMGVLADAAPDVVTYPDLAFAIWAETSGGQKTGNFFYYDGATWQPWKLQDGTLTADAFADGTIPKEKLSRSGGLALQVPAINGAGNAWTWSYAIDLISAGTLALTKLAPGTNGDVMYMSGGVWTSTPLQAVVDARIAATDLPASNIYDDLGTAVANQVMAFPGPGDAAVLAYADTLLRNNSVPTNKLQLGASKAGKIPKVNAGGDDFDYISPNVGSVAVFSYGGAAGTASQTISSGALRTVNFNVTQSDAASLMTLIGNQFKFNATGTYLVRAYVKICNQPSANEKGYILFRNVTTATDIDTSTFYTQGSSNGWPSTVYIECVVTPANTTDFYELGIEIDTGTAQLDDGQATPVNLSSRANRYQRISFTKLA